MGSGKERAGRNRTISLSPGEEKSYLRRCVNTKNMLDALNIKNSIILDDCFNVFPCLPDKFVDLLIVDPPYNLEKIYSASTFRKMDSGSYEAFTRKWIRGLLHTLKETASIYVCSDWRTSLLIGKVLGEFFIIQNRLGMKAGDS